MGKSKQKCAICCENYNKGICLLNNKTRNVPFIF